MYMYVYIYTTCNMIYISIKCKVLNWRQGEGGVRRAARVYSRVYAARVHMKCVLYTCTREVSALCVYT